MNVRRLVALGLVVLAACRETGSVTGAEGPGTTGGGGSSSGNGSSTSGGGSSTGGNGSSTSGGGSSTSGDGSSSGGNGSSTSGAASSSSGSDGGVGTSARLFVSPSGTGTACTQAAPCSIAEAQRAVRGVAPRLTEDAVVELADGVYPLDAPLVFTAADSGVNGHTITWQAAAGAHPVLSGARRIAGWSVADAGRNIWKAAAPGDFATRQLFVDRKLAVRARGELKRSDLTFTTTGFRASGAALGILNGIAHPEGTELHAIGSWTDRYAPVQSLASGVATMVQPAWANNTWGWDTLPKPFRAGPVYLENARELLDEPGEWYLDTGAGTLYYKPLAGQDMSSADVELPRLEALVVVGGTLAEPVHDLAFRGLTFSYTSWLRPNGPDGFADQQTGAFIAGSGYPEFEATRPKWRLMPAAVQVSAARRITFERDRFVALGQVALGIGNDDDAHHTGVGLGADGVAVIGCVFTQIAAGGIAIGGIQENAHHPADARMVNRNITISNNLVHHIGIDVRDSAAIFLTYTQKALVSHNELHDLPYSGINTGYGWGANDAGGSDEYANRGLYNYQPRYTTPTLAQDNTIAANLVHHAQLQMNDGGCLYNLSANPGTVFGGNHCDGAGSGLSGSYVGVYADEGSRSLAYTRNVFTSFGVWAAANANAANNTGNLSLEANWVSGVANVAAGSRGNVVTGNVVVGSTLPLDAQAVVRAAGLEAAYADLKAGP